ncbi:MAG TPA: 3-oxoacyl-[acyl-carrier-protein] reductase [Myxococcales bacterium]|nr:3-oxoacyl-[acyl-carrier-protein] reductase [Myxococcales bacterium]
MRDFEGQVALVTGGSRGIGRACCLAFARRGAKVAVNYAGNEAAAAETAKLVVEAGGEARLCRFDVADAEAAAKAVDETVTAWGRLDVLVNNAGVAMDGLLLRLKEDDLDRQLAVNVKGAFFLAKAAARPMMKQRQGSIVNLSSVVGEMGNAGQAAYAATKAALLGFTKSLARELASRNIRVNAVAPGFIDTDMTGGIAEAQRQKMLEVIPAGRLGTADEVASVVAFLASKDAAYVTGETIRVNGGMYM